MESAGAAAAAFAASVAAPGAAGLAGAGAARVDGADGVAGLVRRGGGGSITLDNSCITRLLARLSSRIALPAPRITSGSFSGGMTISATTNNTIISPIPTRFPPKTNVTLSLAAARQRIDPLVGAADSGE